MSLLDLPTEVLANIVSKVDEPSALPNLAATCSCMRSLTLPVLWENLALDLSGNQDDKADSQFLSKKQTEKLLRTVSRGLVSRLAMESVQQVSVCVSEETTDDLLGFVGQNLVNSELLPDVGKLEVTGTSWVNVNSVKGLLAGFVNTSIVEVGLYDLSLSTLVEVVMPEWQANDQITALGVTLTAANHTSDLKILADMLELLPQLTSFSLGFSYDFDLADSVLVDGMAKLFSGLDKKVDTVKVFDFPPYLSFDPAWLSCSVAEFVFHTNEIDCEASFMQSLLKCTQLKRLSVSIVQSIEQPPLARFKPTVKLSTLEQLSLDTPNSGLYLPAVLAANRQLRQLAISNMSTSTLVSLFGLPDLAHFTIYSFASSACATSLTRLILKSTVGHLHPLRTLVFPTASSPVFTMGERSVARISNLFIFAPALTATVTPTDLTANNRQALGRAFPFMSADELELFMFYTNGLAISKVHS